MRLAGAFALVLLLHAAGAAGETCFPTGGGELTLCHAVQDEGVYGQPSKLQIEYNTQIIALGDGRYATVLHSEAEDFQRYLARTGIPRPGDSIKAGVVDTRGDPDAALHLPPGLGFRIWGSLTDRQSPLFYGYDGPAFPATGLSGGANPMVVAGPAPGGGTMFYVFFLGVMSDGGQGRAFRNVLLEARTADFEMFEVLQRDAAGQAVWVKFAGDAARPAVVTDAAGQALRSNQAAVPEPAGSTDPARPQGTVTTAGLFGSIVRVDGVTHYFYTDQDPADPARNHLYERTTRDIERDGQWSAPSVVLDVPAEVMVRVAKARGMNRWAVIYSCLQSERPFVSDLCVQYTGDMSVQGPRGLGGLTLFRTPYDGVSAFALGLRGAGATALRAQHFDMADGDGTLAVPPGSTAGGVLTWLELPIGLHLLGAPTYWAAWRVQATGRASK